MFPYTVCFSLLGLVVASPTFKAIEDVRIVGGDDIEITEAPYQVSILYRGRHSCGGAIVYNDIIATAAHCIAGGKPRDYQVRVGSSFNHNGGYIYQVADLIWHPDFSYTQMDNDIALLWLATPVEFTESVAAVEMFNKNDEITDGEITLVTGWGHLKEGGGYPAMLQKVQVPKVNEAICTDAYMPLYKITPRMLCAGVPQGGKDACQGDSGGPLIYKNKLAGIVSWGLGCARPDFPGVYAKISALRDWIDENILLLRFKHILRSSQ